MRDMIDKLIFVKLAKKLVESGVNVEFESDWEHWKEHREIKYTEVPYIGSGWYNGRDGFYFKKRGYHDWSQNEEIEIRLAFQNLEIDGYRLELQGIEDVESDDDRLWNANFSFFVEKI
jgi:hypothetical protein